MNGLPNAVCHMLGPKWRRQDISYIKFRGFLTSREASFWLSYPCGCATWRDASLYCFLCAVQCEGSSFDTMLALDLSYSES